MWIKNSHYGGPSITKQHKSSLGVKGRVGTAPEGYPFYHLGLRQKEFLEAILLSFALIYKQRSRKWPQYSSYGLWQYLQTYLHKLTSYIYTLFKGSGINREGPKPLLPD